MIPPAARYVLIAALFVLIAFLLALGGCATSQPAPPAIQAGVTTLPPQRIPVLVPCLEAKDVPPPPATYMDPRKPGWQNQVAAAIDLKMLDEYVVRSQTVMLGCVKAFEQEVKK